MKGTILSNGILRAEDGKRYTFKLDEIQNLSKFPYTDEHSLDGIEVDFETGENNEATSLLLITTKEAKITPPPPRQPNYTQGSVESSKHSFCEEIQTGIESKFIVFRGIIENPNDSQTTHTFGEVKGNARRVTGAISSLIQKDKRFKMGDKTFVFDINAVGKLAPLLALSGAGAVNPMLSAISSSNDINLESGDEVIVAALKDKNTGLYRVEALKNLSKDYHFSHLKHNGGYLALLLIFSVAFFGFGLLFMLFGNKSEAQAGFFMVVLFFVGRFFALRLFGVTKRKKLDKFIKNYTKS